MTIEHEVGNEVEAEEVEVAEAQAEETEAEAETESEGTKEATKPTESLADRRARLMRQLDQTNKKLGIETPKPETKSSKKSNDFDYGEKAYLSAAHGIKGTAEFDFVKKEMKESGFKDLDALLGNPYFKSRLEEYRAISKTAEATPTGKRSGGVPTDTVEYWAAKPIEEVPADMRAKVVNFKLAKENTKGMFYNS